MFITTDFTNEGMACQLKRCGVVHMYPLYENSLGLKGLLSFVSESIIWILTLVRERATYKK